MVHPRMKRLLALLLVLMLCLAALVTERRYQASRGRTNPGLAQLISPELLAQFTALDNSEKRLDATVWAQERRAEQAGAVLDALWDSFNTATNRFDALASFPVGQLVVSQYRPAQAAPDGIQLWEPGPTHLTWFQNEWQSFLAQTEHAGWRLDHLEFRQRGFQPGTGTQAEQSRFSFRADATTTNGLDRATLEGELIVEWTSNPMGHNQRAVKRLDATRLSLRTRHGQPAFTPILTETVLPPEKWLFIDPLILYDLDGDGRSEIILAGKNLVYHRKPDGQYEPGPLCLYPPGRILTAVVADFDGDGIADFLCAKPEGLILYAGSPGGHFDQPGRVVWAASPPLKYAQVLTCGDINHDGHLDVFLAQYKSPYFHGQMPTPYYNADDGDPAYLLVNDGKGNFSDHTQGSGLEPKRRRRAYSGSFVRLSGERDPDLVLVSDFAGMDLFRNNGKGHFIDVTRQWLPDSMGFGMGLALADYNVDGALDLLMIGMDSPTVDRLESLGLSRSQSMDPPGVRCRLASGNRLFLAQPGGGFATNSLNPPIARSGWSWGSSSFDFDNDGYPDVYIANGHESRASVRDYEPEFWLHDIYVAGSTNNRALDLYFQAKFTRTRGRGESYGGYEQNRLYINQGARSFLEAGYLLGVGLEQDCRNVVSDDLDGDGAMDLLVTTFEVWPQPRQTLRVYRNTLAHAGNWIGFRFREQPGAWSPVGTSVTLHYSGHSATAQLVTGDSYRSQSANTLHFGLGSVDQVEQADIDWPDGSRTRLEQPAANQYHLVTPRPR